MTSRFKQVLLEKARADLAEAVLGQVFKEGLNETFQDLNMKKRAGRVDRVIKGRDRQIKRSGSRGPLGNVLRGRAPGSYTPRDPEALERAYDKKRRIVGHRGDAASFDKEEQERRGGGTYNKNGRRVNRALKDERKERGEGPYKDSDEDRKDLPPSGRIQRRRDKVDSQVQNKKDNEAHAAKLAQKKRADKAKEERRKLDIEQAERDETPSDRRRDDEVGVWDFRKM